MNKIIVSLLIAAVIFSFSALVQAEDNQLDVNIIAANIGTTAAGTSANSPLYRIPQAAKISSIYITDLSGVASDATDYVTVSMFLNNATYGTFTSSDTAIVAVTPIALTPTGTALAAGDIVQFKLVKVASGKATTNMGVTVAYHNTN